MRKYSLRSIFSYSENRIGEHVLPDKIREILGGLLGRANRMLKDTRIHYGDMMNTALIYMINSWLELLNYRYEDRYDIDNTEAECKILTHVFLQPMTKNKDNESLLPGKLALQTV